MLSDDDDELGVKAMEVAETRSLKQELEVAKKLLATGQALKKGQRTPDDQAKFNVLLAHAAMCASQVRWPPPPLCDRLCPAQCPDAPGLSRCSLGRTTWSANGR